MQYVVLVEVSRPGLTHLFTAIAPNSSTRKEAMEAPVPMKVISSMGNTCLMSNGLSARSSDSDLLAWSLSGRALCQSSRSRRNYVVQSAIKGSLNLNGRNISLSSLALYLIHSHVLESSQKGVKHLAKGMLQGIVISGVPCIENLLPQAPDVSATNNKQPSGKSVE